ncbi:MAG: hypothetical protein J7502_19595 [Flavisolibacter sp.]|nr:hypothetical protein [Flavisolibacter sp.]
MNCRVTLNENETFLELLKAFYHSKEKVHLLMDSNGIAREEGFIMNVNDSSPSSESIKMDNGLEIPVKNIIAVNGVFLPEFGEC